MQRVSPLVSPSLALRMTLLIMLFLLRAGAPLHGFSNLEVNQFTGSLSSENGVIVYIHYLSYFLRIVKREKSRGVNTRYSSGGSRRDFKTKAPMR